MTIGVFTVLAMYDRPERPVETIDDLAGLSRSHPGVAFLLLVLLLSLIGFPFTAGWTGKVMIFFGALQARSDSGWLYQLLAVIMAVNAAVGAWYYLRIISAMYLRTAVKPIRVRGSVTGWAALAVCFALTVGLSVGPGQTWLLRGAADDGAGRAAGGGHGGGWPCRFPMTCWRCYPALLRGPATALGNHGGFSGACLFRVDSAVGPLCLRLWPPGIDAARLAAVHALMRRATDAGLDYVPRVQATTEGATLVPVADGYGELTTWMPGGASFREAPSHERLRAACIALARLHRAWADPPRPAAPCPAIERRLAVVNDWLPRSAAGWQPPCAVGDPVAPWAARAWALVRQRLPDLPALLAPWRTRPMPLQPCLCDIWHDHMLFTGDRVTGIVDFGSCKVDHVAVDLARLLGSLIGDETYDRRTALLSRPIRMDGSGEPSYGGDDPAMWAVGLEAYAQVRPLTAEERGLAQVLDRSGVVVAAANWLRWLYLERRTYADRAAVAARLAALVGRLEQG